MTAAQDDALWSSRRQPVKGTRLAKVGHAWRLTLTLACGHEAHQDFPIPSIRRGYAERRHSRVADDNTREKATRAQTAIKAAGFAPCLACGPDPDAGKAATP